MLSAVSLLSKMFEVAVGDSRCVTPKWKVGDIVAHPSREWPWLGVVQGNGLAMLVRCTCCGQPKPQTFTHHQATFDQVPCEEDDYFQSSEEIDELEVICCQNKHVFLVLKKLGRALCLKLPLNTSLLSDLTIFFVFHFIYFI